MGRSKTADLAGHVDDALLNRRVEDDDDRTLRRAAKRRVKQDERYAERLSRGFAMLDGNDDADTEPEEDADE
jgi:hypothetical protein